MVIPARQNWFLIVFLAVWLCGWAAGESTAIADRDLEFRSFAQLSDQRHQKFACLRACVQASLGFHRSGRGARTIRLAPSLDEAEAKMLVNEFRLD